MFGDSVGTLQNLRIAGVLAYSKNGNIIMYRYRDITVMLEGDDGLLITPNAAEALNIIIQRLRSQRCDDVFFASSTIRA